MNEPIANPRPNAAASEPPLLAHVIYRLDVGGLENGLVNLVNHMPASEFRHAVICLTDYTDFRKRITRPDVEVFALRKPPGNSLAMQGKLLRVLRRLRPAVVHSRNLAALECQFTAALAGVKARVHSEHGRDMANLDGNNWRHLLIRRVMRPVVGHYIALSRDLEGYLRERVGVDPARLSQIYNGVDTKRFRPAEGGREPLPVPGFSGPDDIVIGTVGRMEPVKDPVNLAQAFVHLSRLIPELRPRLRLVMVGDGALREQVCRTLDSAGLLSQAWLPGSRDGIGALLRGLDIFVLPSRSEGISNTILEAMATRLPVVATRTGGNPELVEEYETGMLAPPNDPQALAQAILEYVRQPDVRREHGHRARAVAVERFSLANMVRRYADIYRGVLAVRPSATIESVEHADSPRTRGNS